MRLRYIICGTSSLNVVIFETTTNEDAYTNDKTEKQIVLVSSN